MKNSRLSVPLKTAIAVVLSVSLLIIPSQPRSAIAASPSLATKSADQYRSEAARFTRALNAIRAIATMRLETGDDLKKALAILDREREGLKFRLSKYISMGLSDSTFTSAVRKRASDQKAAEALVKQMDADPKVALSIEGAAPLKTRIERSGEADAATLRLVANRLKEAAERIRKAGKERAAHAVKKERVSFTDESESSNATKALSTPQLGVPVVVAVIIIVAIVVVVSLFTFALGRRTNRDVEADVAECQQGVDQQRERCVSNADDLPSGFPLFLREAAVALCYSEWLLASALCLAFG